MSDPTSSVHPTAPARPSSVTIASYLLYAVAGLLLLNAVAGLTTIGTTSKVYRSAYAGTEAEGGEAVAVASTIGGAVVSILFALGLVVLALFNNRGRNASRITTWVIGGLVLCCNGLNLGTSALLNSVNVQSAGNTPDPAELQRRLEDALPSWYGALTITVAVLVILATLAALILLALPASNEFFRNASRKGDPQLPGAPGYPSYPTYPPVGSPTDPPGPPADPPGPPADPPGPPANPPGPPQSN